MNTHPAGVGLAQWPSSAFLESDLSNAALTEERAFDILDRMTNLVYRNASAAIVGSFSYRYDVLGLVTQKISYVAASSVTNFYAYDKIGRLTNEIIRQSGNQAITQFSYDLAGNRLTAGASTYTYANNRLNGALHDTAGNITNLLRGTTALRMSWNTLGQLTSVTTNNVPAESYAYDPLGRRVKTTTGGTTIYHVYSGKECAADLDSSGNPLRSYTFGQGIDNLLAVTVYATGATNTYYAVKDHLSSVQALVNASGVIVESYTYDAWGNTTIKNAGGSVITASAYGNRYMFQGREYSTVTGLYNFRARWYAPTIGRWLSKDPIGLEGGLNLYAFCGNCPVMFRDPKGLEWEVFPSTGGIVGYSFDPGPVNEAIAGAIGKVWNLPNTAMGLSIFGTMSLLSDRSSIHFRHNAIEYLDLDGMLSAMTIGNVIGYNECYYEARVWREERLHTYQGEITGPFYLPLHLVGGAISVLSTFEFNSMGWHINNFMEVGPMEGRVF